MKVLITADIHNGHRTGDSLWAMKVIREYAHKNNIDYILALGDVFDNRESLYISTISEVYEFFKEAAEKYDQGWLIFPGNHDMFLRNSWKVNSLQFLDHYTNIASDISYFNMGGRKFWILPFIHHETTYMQVVDEINSKATEEDIMLTHIGVSGAVMNQCFLHKNWGIVTYKDTKFAKVFAGHFHIHQETDNVVYPGSPIAFNFDEGLADHGFLEYDIKNNDYKFIDTRKTAREWGWEEPPDFVILTDELDLKSDEIKGIIKGNNVKVVLTKEHTQNELSDLRGHLEESGSNKVAWQKKKEDISLDDATAEEITTKSVMETFFEKDNPAGYHKELLLKLDKIICKDAEEAIAAAEADDD